MKIANELAAAGLKPAVVLARGLRIGPAPQGLDDQLSALIARRAGEDFPGAERKKAVRDLLRAGGYKPAGRGKPASEYLAQACRKGACPRINAAVDINNLLSLESGFPISILDAARFSSGLKLRHGRQDESYVFNASGQEIALAGLIVACDLDSDRPYGNPVKDSMAGKITDATRALLGVVYSPGPDEELAALARRFAALLEEHTAAEEVSVLAP